MWLLIVREPLFCCCSDQTWGGWLVSVLFGGFGEGREGACFQVPSDTRLEHTYSREYDYDSEISVGAGVGLVATSSSDTMY